MSGRIETNSHKTASEYKYSRGMTISSRSAGVDLEKDIVQSNGIKLAGRTHNVIGKRSGAVGVHGVTTEEESNG